MKKVLALIDLLPDSKVENDLVLLSKELNEELFFDILKDHLDNESISLRRSCLRIIKRAVKEKVHLLTVLDIGLKRKNISEIGFWFECLFPVLGVRRAIAAMKKYAENYPELVIFSWYNFSAYISKNNPNLLPEVEVIRSKINSIVDEINGEDKEYWMKVNRE